MLLRGATLLFSPSRVGTTTLHSSARRGLATSSLCNAQLKLSELARVDGALQRHVETGKHLGASILVGHGGNVVHQSTVGKSATGRPAQATDKHMLLSLSKAFTAALVLRAIHQGWFDLSTYVEELMPGFGVKGKQDATVAQLLSHTAGLPTATIAPPLKLQELGYLEVAAKAACELDALYRPGQGSVYSSGVGYDVLGQILVNTDPKSRSFSEIAADELFAPLGLKDTTFALPVDDPARVPVVYEKAARTSYTDIFSNVVNNLNEDRVSASAGASSTLYDLFKFTEFLAGRGATLLSPDLLTQAKENQTGDQPFVTMAAFDKASVITQLRATMGLWGLFKTVRKNKLRASAVEEEEVVYPANFNLLGGSVRGFGHELSSLGQLASTSALGSEASGTSSLLYDPERDLTVVFLATGIVDNKTEATRHVAEINDLVLAAAPLE